MSASLLLDPPAFRAGSRASLPVALSCGAYGLVYGVLAHGQGWNLGDVLAQGLIVFAGSAQFVALQMWSDPPNLGAILIAVLAINLRYLLIGASLRQVFAGASLRDRIFGMHFVADENWVVTMAAARRGEASPGFLLGGGLTVAAFWIASSLVGCLLGGGIPDPNTYGLDFAFTAAFTVMAMALRRDRRDVAVWSAAALGAVAGQIWLGGVWYIIAGTASGIVVAAASWRGDKEATA